MQQLGSPFLLLSFADEAATQVTPALEVRDADEKPRRLADLSGKKFFRRRFTLFRDAFAELQKQDVEVWPVSTDLAEERMASMSTSHISSCRFVDKSGQVLWVDKQINPRTCGADVRKLLRRAGLSSVGEAQTESKSV